MAVVRCPKHNVPYNEDNPRGCPACWQETVGDDPAALMRELARASREIPRVEILPVPTDEEAPPDRYASGTWPSSVAQPVTQPPRAPVPEPTRLERLGRFARAHLPSVIGAAVITITVALLWVISRPTFESALEPPLPTGSALPFPVTPNGSILGVFALLGTHAPQVHPDSPTLARYDFGRGALVDVYNGLVYAITLTTPARSWQGLRVGIDEKPGRGRLALLGVIQEDRTPAAAPFPFGGYLAYRSRDALPRRELRAEVRPPNGCYDVQLLIEPRIIGTASRGDEAFVAVARHGGTPSWVVYRVRVVSRALLGPYAGPPVCE